MKNILINIKTKECTPNPCDVKFDSVYIVYTLKKFTAFRNTEVNADLTELLIPVTCIKYLLLKRFLNCLMFVV